MDEDVLNKQMEDELNNLLTTDEAGHILASLIRTMAKHDVLTTSLQLEDKLSAVLYKDGNKIKFNGTK